MVADRPLLEVVSHLIGFHLFQVSSKELLHTAKAWNFFILPRVWFNCGNYPAHADAVTPELTTPLWQIAVLPTETGDPCNPN